MLDRHAENQGQPIGPTPQWMVEGRKRRTAILADRKFKNLQLDLTLERTLDDCYDNGFIISESLKKDYGSRLEAGNSISVLIDEIQTYCVSTHVARGFSAPAGKPTSRSTPPQPSRKVPAKPSPAAGLASIAAETEEAARWGDYCKCIPLREFSGSQ